LEVVAKGIYLLNFTLDPLCVRLQCGLFSQNSDRDISVVMRLLNSAI